jgi:hypothetical protein
MIESFWIIVSGEFWQTVGRSSGKSYYYSLSLGSIIEEIQEVYIFNFYGLHMTRKVQHHSK